MSRYGTRIKLFFGQVYGTAVAGGSRMCCYMPEKGRFRATNWNMTTLWHIGAATMAGTVLRYWKCCGNRHLPVLLTYVNI